MDWLLFQLLIRISVPLWKAVVCRSQAAIVVMHWFSYFCRLCYQYGVEQTVLNRQKSLDMIRHERICSVSRAWPISKQSCVCLGQFSPSSTFIQVFGQLYRFFFKLHVNGLTLDLDSTVTIRYHQQEGAARGYNPRKRGRYLHHSLTAMISRHWHGRQFMAKAWQQP
jgi:hypothetical protein